LLSLCESPRLLPEYVACASARFSAQAFATRTALDLGVRVPPGVARAVLERRAEYVAGRHCAARAVGAILPTFTGDIFPGPDRAPSWPAGVVGAITHAHGFASAAAATTSRVRGVGIDAERSTT
jgi:enterobactin synthetase component D